MSSPMPQGAQVFIWCRPETNLILLFGQGRFEGMTYVNGDHRPTVRLGNGREITIHQPGVYVGLADEVAKTCKQFQGDVIEWDLDAFLRGERPTTEQRIKVGPASSNGALPPPKTATDKLMYLKREIELEESKKKLAQQMIENCDKVIAAKKLEINGVTNAVLSELAAVNPDIIRLVAEQVAAQQAAKIVDEPKPRSPLTAAGKAHLNALVDSYRIELPVDDDHTKLAVED